MKERPILFSGAMVRAILEGRKTVTRRIVKPSWPAIVTEVFPYSNNPWAWMPPKQHNPDAGWDEQVRACPYGKPGDRLWVRESWWQAGDWQATYPEDDTGAWFGSKRIVYSADGAPPNEPNRHYPSGLRNGAYSAAEPNKIWRHRPSIHMPRWASRILLEITAVRVEPLQHITIGQICREGLARSMYEFIPVTTAFDAFADLWNSTGGDWDANPWVWVVEFKRVTP